MGRIFKTPTDDSTEATLRAMHIANTVDTAYERAWGWLKAVIFSIVSALTVSAIEFHSDWSLWGSIERSGRFSNGRWTCLRTGVVSLLGSSTCWYLRTEHGR